MMCRGSLSIAFAAVFPDGNQGIREMQEATGWHITAHNRYWSRDTNYAVQNGGNWSFYVDQSNSPAGGQMALPLQQAFWEWLLTSSQREWGLTTYEQDWLYNELSGVDLILTSATVGRQWLLQMNAGAVAAGLTIQVPLASLRLISGFTVPFNLQYCMAYPRHALQTVELSQVTQIRASDDHVPGMNYYGNQWKLGYSSLLAWALGLAPFKDNYWCVALYG